jgi:DUF4097 and DUF4098 domain-containing protein YvlB
MTRTEVQVNMRLTAVMIFAAAAAAGQQVDNQERTMTCDSGNRSRGDQTQHCEIREFTVAGVRQLTVDGGPNGGVQVKGWSRNDILVRAQVQVWAPAGTDPAGMASQVHVQTGGTIQANGPQFGDKHGWAVSYEVFVPHRTDLSLKARNGGISIRDVSGDIQFDTTNGGVSLQRLAGNVRGKTRNGGLSVELAGTRWEGQEMRAETTNGGVSITMPQNYSAQFETATVNGRLNLDIPLPAGVDTTRDVSVRIGAGGPLVRATTVNGGVTIKRKS